LGVRNVKLAPQIHNGRPLTGIHYFDSLRSVASSKSYESKPIKKILCANRGEIAIRVFRACTELDIASVAIFSKEDRISAHRFAADESYQVGTSGCTPVGAYLDQKDIVRVCKENDIDAVHPGYGFLSESAPFARACEREGITFIGPSSQLIDDLGCKTAGRDLANKAKVPVIPGSDGPVETADAAKHFAKEVGYPVILKAAMGGGGRGMRIVNSEKEMEEAFKRCRSEAESFFGDGTVFVEKFLLKPRHIEVQIFGDRTGNVIHLFERDCSIQRRHQKVIELAPASTLPTELRQSIIDDAVRLARVARYTNAGTFEFLVDSTTGKHYFIEVNPRVQVEHTCTEEVTGVDIVQTQIKIASGQTLEEQGLVQDKIKCQGTSIQCRITTEDPTKGFQPDTGTLRVYRSPGGMGVRLDGGSITLGSQVSPHYDSLLVKAIVKGNTIDIARTKMKRALKEFRIRGVTTNIPFLTNVLNHPKFIQGSLHTRFIDETPELFTTTPPKNRATGVMEYLADIAVNGRSIQGTDLKASSIIPQIPKLDTKGKEDKNKESLRQVFLKRGPNAFASAVRAHDGLLVTDTTWRDAHQSLLATRVRTKDLIDIAPVTSHILRNAYSLEMWGGATFDVALRFLHECPWERLQKLRDLVPDIPFQMLLRGANGVGYTSYPDNAIYEFCDKAVKSGMDIFRVFDSLNYVENLKLGIDAAGRAGGIVEGALSYAGDVSDPNETKYSLDYYMALADELVKSGIHVLTIKDMAGLLKPKAGTLLVSELRKAHPGVPLHIHTHDTAGTGVASMLACAAAGADVVDAAVDSMSGTTSQPSMGAIVASMHKTGLATGIELNELQHLIDYWEELRGVYRPFESGQLSGSADVYINEIPGGQYTNLQFQARSLGLAGQWSKIKKTYAQADQLLGHIIKVTPTSKVVGDLAQFMVQNNLSPDEVKAQAATLNFPSSVIEFLRGELGEPIGGFPEPFRSDVLKARKITPITGRPGASMEPLDFDKLREELVEKHGAIINDTHVMSAAMYPKVFDEFMEHRQRFGDVSTIPTREFIDGLNIGEEVTIDLAKGKQITLELLGVSQVAVEGKREVFMLANGTPRHILVEDTKAMEKVVTREKASKSKPGHVGAPMQGKVIDVQVKEGDTVEKGDSVAIISAMKMETSMGAPISGKITRIVAQNGDSLAAGDLIVEITPA